jgi:hypothetical protein
MRWCHCQRCIVTDTSVAPVLLPLSRGCLCPRCAGIVTLAALVLPPVSQTGVCPVMTQPQHINICDDISVLIVIASGFFAIPGVIAGDWPSIVRPMLRRCLCRCCTGVLAHIALASLPALHMHCCRHCAGIVAWASLLHPVGVIALVSPVSPIVLQTGFHPVLTPSQPGIFPRIVQAFFLALHWCSCPHHAGIIARIALSLLPALCRHCPPCCTGISPVLR